MTTELPREPFRAISQADWVAGNVVHVADYDALLAAAERLREEVEAWREHGIADGFTLGYFENGQGPFVFKVAPTIGAERDSDSMVTRNPAPHAAPSSAPSPSKTFTINAAEPSAAVAGETPEMNAALALYDAGKGPAHLYAAGCSLERRLAAVSAERDHFERVTRRQDHGEAYFTMRRVNLRMSEELDSSARENERLREMFAIAVKRCRDLKNPKRAQSRFEDAATHNAACEACAQMIEALARGRLYRGRKRRCGMSESINECSALHPHEPDVPPVLDEEGRCLVCVITHASGLMARSIAWLTADLKAANQRAEAAERERRIAELKASGTLANNLCPDHRDKQVGRPCLACEIERLQKRLDAALHKDE